MAFYSDDSILTIAILDAILSGRPYNEILKKYIKDFLEYKPFFEPYFKNSFSPNLIKWSKNDIEGLSNGNGAMMRISPVGFLFETEKDVINNARLATIPSHNSKEAVECATIIARIIFMAKKGFSKEEIISKLKIKLKYEPFLKFNTTCYETINNCLYALFTSENFEESIIKILSYGGDTDTNACIVGSLAEALYGIEEQYINIAKEKIPNSFVKKLDLVYNRQGK